MTTVIESQPNQTIVSTADCVNILETGDAVKVNAALNEHIAETYAQGVHGLITTGDGSKVLADDGSYVSVVLSFKGRFGPVTPTADDYLASQVANDSTIAGAYVDDALNVVQTHLDDTTVHYLQTAIDHDVIQNRGTNTHAQIDSHIGDSSTHYPQTAIDHQNLQNIGTNSHTAIDSHIADPTQHVDPGGVNGQVLIRDTGETSNQRWGDVSAPPGNEVAARWTLVMSTDPPVTGNWWRNNALASATTQVKIHQETDSGLNVGATLGDLTTSDAIAFEQDTDDTFSEIYTVTGPAVLNGQVYEIPVAFVAQGSSGQVPDTQLCEGTFVLRRLVKSVFGRQSDVTAEVGDYAQFYAQRPANSETNEIPAFTDATGTTLKSGTNCFAFDGRFDVKNAGAAATVNLLDSTNSVELIVSYWEPLMQAQIRTVNHPMIVQAGGGNLSLAAAGSVLLDKDPTADLGAVTKQFVDAHTGNASIHFADAPADGSLYGRRNNTWDILENPAGTYVRKDGDSMTGNLTMLAGTNVILNSDPTADLHASTKQYVDAHSSRTDNPHSVTAAQAQAVALSGDTMTGLLTLSGDPTANLHASTKQYSDTLIANHKSAGINDHDDVDLGSAVPGQLAVFDGSKWIPVTVPTNGHCGLYRTPNGARFTTQTVGNSWTVPNFLTQDSEGTHVSWDGTDFTIINPFPGVPCHVEYWLSMGCIDVDNDDREHGVGVAVNGVVDDDVSPSMLQVKKDAAGTTVSMHGFGRDIPDGTRVGPRIRDFEGSSSKRYHFLDFMMTMYFEPASIQSTR